MALSFRPSLVALFILPRVVLTVFIAPALNKAPSFSAALWESCRGDALTLLNQPLQLLLATGTLPLGSFKRLVCDRKTVLEGICEACDAAAEASATPEQYASLQEGLSDELQRHAYDAAFWQSAAISAGKPIDAPVGTPSYEIDGTSSNQAAKILHSLLYFGTEDGLPFIAASARTASEVAPLAGATAILRGCS